MPPVGVLGEVKLTANYDAAALAVVMDGLINLGIRADAVYIAWEGVAPDEHATALICQGIRQDRAGKLVNWLCRYVLHETPEGRVHLEWAEPETWEVDLSTDRTPETSHWRRWAERLGMLAG